jgi:hypothetical protein
VAGNEVPAIRDRWVNAFNNRADFFDWLGTPEKAEAFLEQVGSRPAETPAFAFGSETSSRA